MRLCGCACAPVLGCGMLDARQGVSLQVPHAMRPQSKGSRLAGGGSGGTTGAAGISEGRTAAGLAACRRTDAHAGSGNSLCDAVCSVFAASRFTMQAADTQSLSDFRIDFFSPSEPSPAEPGQRRSMGTLNCEVGTPVEMCLAWTQVARLLSLGSYPKPKRRLVNLAECAEGRGR